MDFNTRIIEEFRANGGRVGGPFEGGRLLLLTTTGARTGAPHTTPLGYLPDGLGRVLVIASAGGAPKNPAWFHNLVADPRVTVESGSFAYEADAVVLAGDERDRAFARAVEADPGWAGYESESGRTLPVVALVPTVSGPPGGPETPGAMLLAVHDAFRAELALIRKEVAASGAGIGAQLRINCLTLCQGLGNHHLGEDTQMFPVLERLHPGLAPLLARLRSEHETVKELLDELRRVLDAGEPASLLAEVERLTGTLEAHLDREEERLVPLLDTLEL
ncbi:nitroreductase/quinone reductase family protein [Actinomadura madurae]|uniref:Deazaflavin-dependent oxidoreductase, nitroreductase family n=1 Tax=Actinomadura madurae TaxID=1993 RepID=A0A1I5AFN4_9ACTN|nr:nitroreductase/quinone reductase family protein [Actinomadura madurae]SFN61205.1 deazaflavin-dependent oxidoreductase, nitroreductase family [Actinomadura madurae]SPT57048.1 Putative nitroreductase Rv1558/MT1609 [Actinomadura madurae]